MEEAEAKRWERLRRRDMEEAEEKRWERLRRRDGRG